MSDNFDQQNSWDMSQERAFMENLFCQRFNFFLIVFSVVLGSAATATNQNKQTAVLGLGCFLCALIALTMYRIYAKLMAILGQLHRTPDHPVSIIGNLVKHQLLSSLGGVNWIVGWFIPLVCTVILAIATWQSSTGRLNDVNPASSQETASGCRCSAPPLIPSVQ